VAEFVKKTVVPFDAMLVGLTWLISATGANEHGGQEPCETTTPAGSISPPEAEVFSAVDPTPPHASNAGKRSRRRARSGRVKPSVRPVDTSRFMGFLVRFGRRFQRRAKFLVDAWRSRAAENA
jgi:hypothetical protein